MIYTLNKRAGPRTQPSAWRPGTASGTAGFTETRRENPPQQPLQHLCTGTLHAQQQLLGARSDARVLGRAKQAASLTQSTCQTDIWRSPRRFVLHLFGPSLEQQQQLQQLQQQQQQQQQSPSHSSLPLSQFLCTSETEGSCAFAVGAGGRFTLLRF